MVNKISSVPYGELMQCDLIWHTEMEHNLMRGVFFRKTRKSGSACMHRNTKEKDDGKRKRSHAEMSLLGLS